MTEFKPIYISMIKNICSSDVINSERERDGKKQIMKHQYLHLIK